MALLIFFSCIITFFLSFSSSSWPTLATDPPAAACKSTCGSLQVKYPFGTGPGCGSPRFQPFVCCASNKDQQQQQQLTLTTHTGSYPITSISYAASTFTITPPLMSTCSSMQPSPNFGIDWATPFQLGSSTFLLLSCAAPPSSSLCDASNSHLCAAIYTCPSVVSLGLPLFAPTNSCCVYSPANLGPSGDLDLQGLNCAAYSSVASLGEYQTDPSRWEYGVVLDYSSGGSFEAENNNYATACDACEKSEGVCGYAPPKNYFVCVCNNGVNTTSDCFGQVAFLNAAAATSGFSRIRNIPSSSSFS